MDGEVGTDLSQIDNDFTTVEETFENNAKYPHPDQNKWGKAEVERICTLGSFRRATIRNPEGYYHTLVARRNIFRFSRNFS